MESIDAKHVKSVWKKKGAKLKNPNIYFAVYMEKVYYVYREIVISLMLFRKNIAK